MGGVRVGGQVAFKTPIPRDLLTGKRARFLKVYEDLQSISRADGHDLTPQELLAQILANTDIDILLKTLGTAFVTRRVTVTSAPTLLIAPNRVARGYILINPSSAPGTSSVTVFASQVFPVGTTTSPNISVGNFLTARMFLDITALGAGATLLVNHQSRNPLIITSFPPVQNDIFAGFAAVGDRYANLGEEGVDQIMRFQMVVAVDTVTASLAAILKQGLLGTTGAGSISTVFLGGSDVSIQGFPLIEGSRETLYLRQNTAIFGRTTTDPVNVNIFELQ